MWGEAAGGGNGSASQVSAEQKRRMDENFRQAKALLARKRTSFITRKEKEPCIPPMAPFPMFSDENRKETIEKDRGGPICSGQLTVADGLNVDFDETALAEIDNLCGQRTPLQKINGNAIHQSVRQNNSKPIATSFPNNKNKVPTGIEPSNPHCVTICEININKDPCQSCTLSTASEDVCHGQLHKVDGAKLLKTPEFMGRLQSTLLVNNADELNDMASVNCGFSVPTCLIPNAEEMRNPCIADINYDSTSSSLLNTTLDCSVAFPVPIANTIPAYLQTLNESQREAVLNDITRPLLILAGPGSGKTSTMVARLLRLLEEGVNAKNILAMTFTTSAATEIKERVGSVAGKAVSNQMTVSTFHSFCLQLCRSNAEKLGRTPEFLIYGHSQQRKAVVEATRLALEEFEMAKNICEPAQHNILEMTSRVDPHVQKKTNLASWKETAKKWQKFVSQAKAAGRSPEDVEKLGNTIGSAVLRQYNAILKACDALDYHDFISSSVKLLQDHPEVLIECQRIWTHILIDEFQDTSAMQYQFLRLLASHNCITAVGDDDQSIFSFNGADSSGFESFRKDFSSLKEVRLQQNYRSTRCIVEASHALIQNNLKRCHAKKAFTDNDSGEKIVVKECRNEDAQCAFVLDTILLNCISSETYKHAYGNVAILYRRQVTGKIFQSALRARRIPFNVHGVAFYRKKVIKNLIAMLYIALIGGKDIFCRRIFKYLYSSDRTESRKAVDYIEKVARSSKCDFLESARNIFCAKVSGTFNRRELAQGRKVLTTIDMIHRVARKERSLSALVTTIVNIFPQRSTFDKRAIVDEDGGRLLNEDDDKRTVLDFLMDDVNDFLCNYFSNSHLNQNNKESDGNGGQEGCLDVLKSFLDHLMARENENFRSLREENKNSITLTTMHQSKGLEWDVVFIVKANDSEIPLVHESMGVIRDGSASLEEERRLFYVAMTRARKKLYIAYVVLDSAWQLLSPSRFLKELPPQLLDVQIDTMATGGHKVPKLCLADDEQRNNTDGDEKTLEGSPHLLHAQKHAVTERNSEFLEMLHTGTEDSKASSLSSSMNTSADYGATSAFLRGFSIEARSTVASLFHCWAKKSAFQDPKRLLGKVGFVIEERLRSKATKNKDLLRALKCSLNDDAAISYAQYVIKWAQMPFEERSMLLAGKKEHFQQHSAEHTMATAVASSKQISYLRQLGCTIEPTSRLHASRLIEQYKSL